MTSLETKRTLIEDITLEDAAFFVELMNSPGWLQYIGDRNITNAEDARHYLQKGFLQSYADNGFGYYVVRLKTNRVPIGTCGFLKKPTLDNPDFGFAFLPDYHGQGYALESCRAVLDFGIESFNFDVLDAVTMSANLASRRLLEKLGFHAGETKTDDGLLLYRWHNEI